MDKSKVEIRDLFRYMCREATEQERIKVEEWMNRSSENKKMYADYYKLFLAVTSLIFKMEDKLKKALEKVNEQIRKKQI